MKTELTSILDKVAPLKTGHRTGPSKVKKWLSPEAVDAKNEQLSPPISQSLANSLASFFYQRIVSLNDSIALKLQGSPTPFDFDLPHSGEVLSDFTPVTPNKVSQILKS